MKTGASDPFADDTEQSEETDDTVSNTSQTEQSDTSDSTASQADTAEATRQFDRSDLPRILARDRVKDDRDDVHQLFVYEDTAAEEKEARRELEDRLGDVYKLDAREAIYRAGMQNIDDAEAILREWGADV